MITKFVRGVEILKLTRKRKYTFMSFVGTNDADCRLGMEFL